VENTLRKEETESSATWYYKNNSLPGAQSGGSGQNPVETKAGGAPLIEESRLMSGSTLSENLECLTEKVGTLGLQIE
jgi:hypothetical protein